jgi:hypothetical protein
VFFYIFKGDGGAVYSPEFGRGGLTAYFAVSILQILNSPTLTITLEGRADDATAWSTITTFSSITTAGVKTLTTGSLPQILRYKFEVAGASETSGVAIQLFAPQWRDV